jgi:type IV pilus assembly protein PilQ
MADVRELNGRATRRRRGAGGALLALLLVACASRPAPKTTTPAPVPPLAAAQAAPPVEITALDLREGAPGMLMDLQASGPLVWTSYRDADGNLVIELPNTTAGGAVADVAPVAGLVESVRIERDESADRPLTRLTVAGREDFEYNLTSEDSVLRVQLQPSAVDRAAVAYEPLPEAEEEAAAPPAMAEAAPVPPSAPVAPAPTPAPAPTLAPPPAPLGTPDQPHVVPAPAGVRATRLDDVDVTATDGVATVRVVGDGAFGYSTFRLENPERFVIDLPGVMKTTAQTSVEVDGQLLERIRVAQYQARPEPVARVVFDLRRPAAPVIQRTGDALEVRFEAAGAPVTLAQDLGTTPAAPPPAAAPVSAAPAAPPPPAPAPVIAAPTRGELWPVEPLPAAEEPTRIVVAPAAPAPAPIPAAPPPPPSDVSLLEAADLQEEPPPATQQPVLQTFGSQTVGPTERRYFGEPISLHLKDADIRDVLRSFAQISGLNIVVHPGVRASVTVELENVPWDQALEQILKMNGLGMELEGNILRIAPVGVLRQEAEEEQRLREAQALSVPLQTVMRRLSYATASEVQRILLTRGGPGAGGSLMSQRGSVTVDPRTNTLIIKELPNFMDTVIAVIENLDTPEPQVMIEARIIETTKRFSRSLGIAWDFTGISDAAHGNTTGLVFPNQGTANGGVNLLTGGSNAFLDLSLGNVLGTFNLDLALQAAEAEGLINILSAPKIATLNNTAAEIQSGLQIPIQTVANNTVTVQFVNATLRLSVTPHVTAEGTVRMDIQIQKREPQLAFAVVGATNAPIATKEARTQVIVRDGGTTVIGGIYEVSTDQGEDRVPGLANIPLLGHLFRNRRRTDENEELLIFITPRVIKL